MTVMVIFTAFSYGFFKYGSKLFDSDSRNVYGVVCKNTNIVYQRISRIEITDDYISVTLKQHTVPYFLIGIDTDPMDFYSAVNIYTELSEQYRDKNISVYTGMFGSCVYNYTIYDGEFWFNKFCPSSFECKLSFYDTMSSVMLLDNIQKISYSYWDGKADLLNSITEALPVNENISEFECYLHDTDDLSVFNSFPGLKILDMCFIYDENTDIDKTNMDFLNDLTQLEELILYADYGHLELGSTENLSVKKVTLYTDGGK